MAKDKTSFILYTDSYGLVKQLPDDVAGRLLKHIFAYVNDEEPKTDELLINIAFEPIKMQLKRDLIKWEAEIESKSESGAIGNLKRWNLDLYEKFKSKEITLKEAISIAKHRKASHPDVLESHPIAKIAVNDNVSVNDNVNDILLKKESKEIFSFKNALMDFGFEKNLIEEWLKVRKTKKATNTETAFKKFIKQVQDTNAPKNEILELCVARSWAGFETEWFLKEKKPTTTEKEAPLVGRMTESAINNSVNAFR
ncbi:DUF6291 domain-containing protein [Flavobacterium sp. GNP002]